MKMQDRLADLAKRRATLENNPNNQKAIDKQHARGKLTARERVELFLDPGTFVEIDAWAKPRMTGFDIDKKACRVYNINRIDYVELKENESWGNTSMHLDTEIDAFHLSGNAALKVSLKLDLLARNQLIEEYPRTKDKIVCDARDSNTWYYNDTVRSVLGVARFYMGLAEHITILEAPIELRSKVKELAQEILSKA